MPPCNLSSTSKRHWMQWNRMGRDGTYLRGCGGWVGCPCSSQLTWLHGGTWLRGGRQAARKGERTGGYESGVQLALWHIFPLCWRVLDVLGETSGVSETGFGWAGDESATWCPAPAPIVLPTVQYSWLCLRSEHGEPSPGPAK